MLQRQDKQNSSLLTATIIGVVTAVVMSTLMDDNKRRKLGKMAANLRKQAMDSAQPVLDKVNGLMADGSDDSDTESEGRDTAKKGGRRADTK